MDQLLWRCEGVIDSKSADELWVHALQLAEDSFARRGAAHGDIKKLRAQSLRFGAEKLYANHHADSLYFHSS